ncbi:MAG: hypothetical protein JWQ40_1381 [Segetibacter sp.]|jgi:hypothetical protein|nr:hypothetical protein [Segetibacter sp.]
MNLLHLSKRERFYYDVGEALAMNNMRCFINQETMEVEINAGEDSYFIDDEDDPAQEALDNPDKYLRIEPVSPREAFRVMADFVETVHDKHMQQRLTDALDGRKPFANFNHLVHSTNVRQQWFDFKNRAYTEMAKEWIEENASRELKEKIKALPAVRSVE